MSSKTYGDEYKVKFDNLEFADLDKMVIEKSVNEHSIANIKGIINKEKVEDSRAYLEQKNPVLTITYGDDDRKILFKGVIDYYNLTSEKSTNYLELKATSYSVLLAEEKRNRIFQNLGFTYNEVLDKLSSDNGKFHISFSESSQGDTPLVSDMNPVILQYMESDWNFIKRIASYLGQIVLVDDTKDDSETINIQIGFHNAAAKELNNTVGEVVEANGKKNIKYKYYKVIGHEHFRSDNIFDVGKKVNYKRDNKTGDTVETVIFKNKIYLDEGSLSSDLTLVEPSNINVAVRKRFIPISGQSFQATVKNISNLHKAQVEFINLEDEFDEGKAYWFTLDRLYTDGYLAPEIEDTVNVYFKSKFEKYATIKSCSSSGDEIDNDPADIVLFTPGNYQIKLNNETILVTGKDEKSSIEILEDQFNLTLTEYKIVINKDEINLELEDRKLKMDSSMIEISQGSTKAEVTKNSIDFK